MGRRGAEGERRSGGTATAAGAVRTARGPGASALRPAAGTAPREARHSDVVAVTRPPQVMEIEGFPTLAEAVREAEVRHIEAALRIANGRKGRAAALLGISRKNLWEKLRASARGGGVDHSAKERADD